MNTPELREQIRNPQHVHIRLADGRLMSHAATSEDLPPTYFKGQIIRYSRLSAERVLASGDWLFEGATAEPIANAERLVA